MKTRYKLLLAVLLVWAQVFAFSLTGGGSALFAQDAFYIYRNDGDFNGFFFDEIKRMGVSKFDLDSIEHDVYVVQEIETADSIYRIPLAAIDSIGFQQPEIRFNPKLKPVAKEGLLQYITYAENGLVRFSNLPANLKPNVGDVLVGFPTDDNASTLYKEGSFGCVVESLDESGSTLTAHGHAINQFSDVFEQYITVEDLGYDEQGNLVRHRIAGAPHRAEGESYDDIINFKGTLTREWNPTENSSISLSADVSVKFRVRVNYKIGWSRLFVKMSKDLLVDIQPSLAMATLNGFEYTLGTLNLPIKIWFPTQCPIFELEPYPDVFIRGGGKLEAKLNFPTSSLCFGDDIIIDTNLPLFPMTYKLHWNPSETEAPDNLIDIGSTDVSLSGFIQAGVKFRAGITTASWYKKLFKSDIYLDLFVGPKIDGKMEFKTDWVNNEGFNLYDQLRKSTINATWLSCDLEAKATASVMWREPAQKTFFSSNIPFFCDTISLMPELNRGEVIVEDENIRYTLRTRKEFILGLITIEPVLVSLDTDAPERVLAHWSFERNRNEYTTVIPRSELMYGSYAIYLDVIWYGYKMRIPSRSFGVPLTIKADKKELQFNCSGNQVLSVGLTTNCPKKEWISKMFYESYGNFIEASIEAVSEEKGLYRADFKAKRNPFFERKCQVNTIISGVCDTINITQEKGDLKGVKVRVAGAFNDGIHIAYSADYDATLSWKDDNSFIVQGSHTVTDKPTSHNGNNVAYIPDDSRKTKWDVSFTVTRQDVDNDNGEFNNSTIITDGVLNKSVNINWELLTEGVGVIYWNKTTANTNITFGPVGIYAHNYNQTFKGELNTAQDDVKWDYKEPDGSFSFVAYEGEKHEQLDKSKPNSVEVTLYFPTDDE